MPRYHPEGVLSTLKENKENLKNLITLQSSMVLGKILEARAIVCDSEHNLIVDLGFMKGVIPHNEGAIGISEGITKDIAIISRVNKPVSFKIISLSKDIKGNPIAILSRKQAQIECMENYISNLVAGDVIDGRITHMESFGCFVDIGCGVSSLLPIDAISVSRINHPNNRFKNGQQIKAVVKSIDDEGRVCLTHKELLGSWEQNAAEFSVGETVAGVVRSIENYGVFIELTPNLAGLAELKDGVKVGQSASVYVKSLIAEKMKVKLIIVDSFDLAEEVSDVKYYCNDNHIDYWKYSPECCEKIVETVF